MRGTWRPAVVLAAAAVVALGACGDDDDDDSGGSSGATLAVTGFAFPPSLSVAAGASIEVTNADSADHTVTADDGSFSVGLPAKGSATLTAPAEAGSYPYHCNVHPSMTGTLVVEA